MAGGKYPGMPFNQQMSLPSELTLRTFPEWPAAVPPAGARRSNGLRGKHIQRSGTVREGENLLAGISGELFDLQAEFEPGTAAEAGFTIRGKPLTYHVAKKLLVTSGKTAPVELVDGKLELRIVVDRASIEVFAQGGRVTLSTCFLPPENDRSLTVFARGGTAELKRFDAWELKSVWP